MSDFSNFILIDYRLILSTLHFFCLYLIEYINTFQNRYTILYTGNSISCKSLFTLYSVDFTILFHCHSFMMLYCTWCVVTTLSDFNHLVARLCFRYVFDAVKLWWRSLVKFGILCTRLRSDLNFFINPSVIVINMLGDLWFTVCVIFVKYMRDDFDFIRRMGILLSCFYLMLITRN